jgi:hypothetical protein
MKGRGWTFVSEKLVHVENVEIFGELANRNR